RVDDLGRDLVAREMNLLSKENDAGGANAYRPALKPYGAFIVKGLPKGHRVLIDRVGYPAGAEINLPAGRHLLEVRDAGNQPVLRDSVAIDAGEPTLFDFSRRAGKQ
ncbi:MAG: hypothetical protein ABI036_04790, partial [Fibrobacteria bacterium]